MKAFFFAFLFIIQSCSTRYSPESFSDGKASYNYLDVSGQYYLIREKKKIKNRIVTRTLLTTPSANLAKPLEKSVVVSEIGTVSYHSKRVIAIRPIASEFTVWLEGQKYSSRMQLDIKNKSMKITLDSPNEKWKGTQSVTFPKGHSFCFFSQIPDCLHFNHFLAQAKANPKKSLSLQIIWDNYPYHEEQYSGFTGTLFSTAVLKFEGERKNLLRYELDLAGQSIIYDFSKSFDLVRISWIAQGITVVPLGEDVESDLEE